MLRSSSSDSIRWLVLAALVALPLPLKAEESLLVDRDGDGKVSYVGFGDSITFGVGDGGEPGEAVEELPSTDGRQGYLKRLRGYLGVETVNEGKPGERLVEEGAERLARGAVVGRGDVVGVLEGSNDAIFRTDAKTFRKRLQKMVNVLHARGKTPLLITPPPPCCDHEALAPFTRAYAEEIRRVARANESRVADLERSWTTSCASVSACELYNLPEGLHPNERGYSVIGQTVGAALLGVDPYTESARSELSGAFGVPLSEIVVLPEGRALSLDTAVPPSFLP